MRIRRFLYLGSLYVVLFFNNTIYSQTSANASGGDALGSGGSASYSVGQVAYNAYSGTNGSMSEGVQQAFEISDVVGIEDTKNIYLKVSVYPNPTTDYLTLEVIDVELSTLFFQLFDTNGKLLQNEKIKDNQTSIAMNDLVPAIYFIKVIQGVKEIKAFKIIKN